MSKGFSHRFVTQIADPRTGRMTDAFARFLDELVLTSQVAYTQTVEKAGGLPFARYPGQGRNVLLTGRYGADAGSFRAASYSSDAAPMRSASYDTRQSSVRPASYGAPCKSIRAARYS